MGPWCVMSAASAGDRVDALSVILFLIDYTKY